MFLRNFLIALSLTAVASCDSRPIEEKVNDALASQAQYIRGDLSLPLLACETALAGGNWQATLTTNGYEPNLSGILAKSSGTFAGDTILVDADGSNLCTITTSGAYLNEFSVLEQGVAQILSQRGQRYVGPAGTRMIFEKQGRRIGVTGSLTRGQVSSTKITFRNL